MRAPLDMLADSWNTWGFVGEPEVKKAWNLLVWASRQPLYLFCCPFLRGLVRLKSILKLLVDSVDVWAFGGWPEVKKWWNLRVWPSRQLFHLVFCPF